jgi:hypothetical protein
MKKRADIQLPRDADVSRHLRRHELNELAASVERGDKRALAQAVGLLRAEGLPAWAALIARGPKWLKRGAPPLSPFEELKRCLVGHMRRLRKRRGRFSKGERTQALDDFMAKLAADGELDRLTDADRERLRAAVLADLDRAKHRRRP